MKNLFMYIVAVCMFFVSVNIANAGNEAGWIPKKFADSDYLTYYTYHDECIVAPHGGTGSGIVFVGMDKNWRGKTLTQVSIVETRDDGGLGRTEFYSVSPRDNDPFVDAQEIEIYKYDIFDTKCRVHTENLPDQVKDAFYKYYDISR